MAGGPIEVSAGLKRAISVDATNKDDMLEIMPLGAGGHGPLRRHALRDFHFVLQLDGLPTICVWCHMCRLGSTVGH